MFAADRQQVYSEPALARKERRRCCRNLEIVRYPTIFFRHFDIQRTLDGLIKVINDKRTWWDFFW